MIPACFPDLKPETYTPSPLHAPDRLWPLTNCSVDIFIEIVSSLGEPVEAMLAFTLLIDLEGDQFTFIKVPTEDLEILFGMRVQELAIYDDLAVHALTQVARGRMPLIELDGFYLPDTGTLSYRTDYAKTTVGVNRIDPERRVLEYFHNGGYYRLDGEDYDGLMRGYARDDVPFVPYSEFIKFQPRPPGDRRDLSRQLLKRHWARRPTDNPIKAFKAVFLEQAAKIPDRKPDYFHKYAFNTLRQLGANFELMASYLAWLDGPEAPGLYHARKISEQAKTVQFLLARASARRRFEPLAPALDPMIELYDGLFGLLADRI